jgi:uncharacterized protein YndB with AHSA1/START domain
MANDKELVSARIFNSPRELVFKAWTDPKHLAEWWGPDGFRNTFHEFDLRPGGTWDFTMHGPDGTDYKNKNVFTEIVRPERIVFRHIELVHTFEVTATFDIIGEKTKLTFRMHFDDADEFEKVKSFIKEANEQNFDRLERKLKKMV